jgi:hypothetical protein
MNNDLAVHVIFLGQLALGSVFLLSALPKWVNLVSFDMVVRNYHLVPDWATRPAALGALTAISLLGASLTAGVAIDVAIPAAIAVLLLFAAAVGINLRRGEIIDCGCFGMGRDPISVLTIARLGMLIAAAVGIVTIKSVAAASPPSTVDLALGHPDQLVLAAMEAALLILLGSWLLAFKEAGAVLRTPLPAKRRG